MAVFPRETRLADMTARDHLPVRWSVLAAALLIAFFGLISGLARDGEFARGLQSTDKSADSPHFAKREPMRAIAPAERRDQTTSHWLDLDGALLPSIAVLAFPQNGIVPEKAAALAPHGAAYWPVPLPRASPNSI
ncbi:MAG: hypothetical protein PW791_08905 [Neorhizobium sp.]|jgi:hypothetical protein|nr:hypothetical protein [Neorhizobium sp.]